MIAPAHNGPVELSDLAIFKAVVEAGGVIAAAARLHRVPSSVSARIRALERSVGAPLFHRERRRLRLASAGERLLPYADRLLTLAAEARVEVAGGAPAGVLKLGALESTAASRLPAALAQLHRLQPAIRIELATGTNDTLTAAVTERRLHAAFVAERPGAHLAAQPAFAERLVLISAIGHGPIRRPRDVAGEPLIAFPEGCAYRRAMQRWLGRRWSGGAPVLELASYHAIVACVAAGGGIALVPESVLETVDTRRIARHPLPAVHAERTTYLISRPGEPMAPLTCLQETLRRLDGSRGPAQRPLESTR
jgi:DNA-binding transcriptional LysR family regulator